MSINTHRMNDIVHRNNGNLLLLFYELAKNTTEKLMITPNTVQGAHKYFFLTFYVMTYLDKF